MNLKIETPPRSNSIIINVIFVVALDSSWGDMLLIIRRETPKKATPQIINEPGRLFRFFSVIFLLSNG